jgi:hypothetical protein
MLVGTKGWQTTEKQENFFQVFPYSILGFRSGGG